MRCPNTAQKGNAGAWAAAQVVGCLADKRAQAGQPVAGVLVRGLGGADLLLAPQDLPTFTKLHPGRVLQRQALPLGRSFSEARAHASLQWPRAQALPAAASPQLTWHACMQAESAPHGAVNSRCAECDRLNHPGALAGAQVRLALEVLFEGVQGVAADLGSVQGEASSSNEGRENITAEEALRIADSLTLTHKPETQLEAASAVLEWEGGPVGDAIADAVIAVLLQACASCCRPFLVCSGPAGHACRRLMWSSSPGELPRPVQSPPETLPATWEDAERCNRLCSAVFDTRAGER